jgi:signal transduction histidine kinase
MQQFSIRGLPEVDLPHLRTTALPATWRYLREVYTAPFRADADLAQDRSFAVQERARRAAILRLILFTTSVVVGVVAVPLALAERLALDDVAVLAALALLSLGALLWCGQGRMVAAALLFVGGGTALGLGFAALHPGGIDIAVLSVYSSIALFILIGMVILPELMAWAVALAAIGLTIVTLVVVPIAPGLMSAYGAGATKTALLGQFVAAQALTALLGWTAARSARAGVRAATAAATREREVTALKERFMLEVNHELRTPIMTWYGNTELLVQMGEHAPPEERAYMTARALEAGDAVLDMLNQVLKVSDLEGQPQDLHPVAFTVGPFLEQVLATYEAPEMSAGGPREVTLHVAPQARAWADEATVRKVLELLLSNALKYSPPGSPLALSVREIRSARRPVFTRWSHSDPPDFVEIRLRDRGLGVPPSDAPKLFNRFVRLERDSVGTVRGIGIGLYQCRLLVEAMGGRIWVESTGVPGEGSAFCFTLPAAPAPRIPLV